MIRIRPVSPKISIVIPTRNRLILLKNAIQSVFAQEHCDWELIISDNASSDGTREYIRELDDKRIKYINPGSYLNIAEHWNFAIRHASGQYILMIGDDDCLAPHALTVFDSVARSTNAQFMSCRCAHYYTSDFPDKSRVNTIMIPTYTGENIYPEVNNMLRTLFSFEAPNYYPTAQTALIAKSLIDRCFSRHGCFFGGPFPEVLAHSIALILAGSYVYIDRPLVVLGRTSFSLGPRAIWRGDDSAWAEVGQYSFEVAPLKGNYWTNGLAECFLRTKRVLPKESQGIDLSWEAYYVKYWHDMQRARVLKCNVFAKDYKEYRSAVESLEMDLRRRIISQIGEDWYEPRTVSVQKFRRMIMQTPIGELLRISKRTWLSLNARKGSSKSPAFIEVHGGDIGVTDILSCACWLSSQESVLKRKE